MYICFLLRNKELIEIKKFSGFYCWYLLLIIYVYYSNARPQYFLVNKDAF